MICELSSLAAANAAGADRDLRLGSARPTTEKRCVPYESESTAAAVGAAPNALCKLCALCSGGSGNGAEVADRTDCQLQAAA